MFLYRTQERDSRFSEISKSNYLLLAFFEIFTAVSRQAKKELGEFTFPVPFFRKYGIVRVVVDYADMQI